MLIAKLSQDLKIEKIADISEFGGFSEIPSDSILFENGYRKVNLWKPHNKNLEKLIPCEPYLEGQWVYTVKVEKLSSAETENLKKTKIDELKTRRNQLLAASDWTQLADSSLDPLTKEKWASYRKEIKEVVVNFVDKNIITPWPVSPE